MTVIDERCFALIIKTGFAFLTALRTALDTRTITSTRLCGISMLTTSALLVKTVSRVCLPSGVGVGMSVHARVLDDRPAQESTPLKPFRNDSAILRFCYFVVVVMRWRCASLNKKKIFYCDTYGLARNTRLSI